MQSLKDKLLKAGLVSQEAAQKAESAPASRPAPPRREERPARHDERPRPAPSNERVPRFAPLAGSSAWNREQSKKQLALDKKLRETVLAAQVVIDDGATPFYFVSRKNKLKRLSLTEAQALRIQSGELAIVERPDPDKIDYALVPVATAVVLHGLSPRAVRFCKSAELQVGFVSDDDIATRSSEADETEAEGSGVSEPEPNEATGESSDTWVTVKRSPKP
jgi:uncharacterized protein YaiL (DUF2058 family)